MVRRARPVHLAKGREQGQRAVSCDQRPVADTTSGESSCISIPAQPMQQNRAQSLDCDESPPIVEHPYLKETPLPLRGHGGTAHTKPDAVAFVPSTHIHTDAVLAAPTQEASPPATRVLTKASKPPVLTESDICGATPPPSTSETLAALMCNTAWAQRARLTPVVGVSRRAPGASAAHVAFAADHIRAGVIRATQAPASGLPAQGTHRVLVLVVGHMIVPC